MAIYTTDQYLKLYQELGEEQWTRVIGNGSQLICRRLLEKLPHIKEAMILCGSGLKGTLGMALATALEKKGISVNVVFVNVGKYAHLVFGKYRKAVLEGDIPIYDEHSYSEILKITTENTVIIDGIAGCGDKELDIKAFELFSAFDFSNLHFVAIDCPSFISEKMSFETENSWPSVDFTFALDYPLPSFYLPNTAVYFGKLVIIPFLGSRPFETETPWATRITEVEAQHFLKVRSSFAHKGSFGHVVIIGGSYGKIGAAVLASRAAFKSGCGMVTTVIPKCGYEILQSSIPEAMVITDENMGRITQINLSFTPDAIAIGMGMGTDQTTVSAFLEFIKNATKPLVIDADALNILATHKELFQHLPAQSILTPHPGELKRLIGSWKTDAEKLEKVRNLAKRYSVIMVIKGAFTIVMDAETLTINTSGNSGMGTAGSGDTLSGIIASLLAQGYVPAVAARLGVFLHGKAGDCAVAEIGEEALMAGTIIEHLSSAYKAIKNSHKSKNSRGYL